MKSAIVLLAFCATAANAQPPRLENARIQTRNVNGNLETQFRSLVAAQSDPAWIGYQLPAVAGHQRMCEEALEGRNGAVNPAAPQEFYVFYRINQKKVEKIRTSSPDCVIDAGGLPVYWLTGVAAPQSVALVETLLPQLPNNSAIAAIALTNDPAADASLDRLVGANQPEQIRRDAAFWLGNSRGRHGYEMLLRVLHEDPSDRVREHAIFALSESREPDAMRAIIQAAHDDKSPHVRGQALFWLAQRAAHQVAATEIGAAILNDPEIEVKRRAVFALTQIPKGDGVPLLIEVARTNRTPAVRKQAMFWLGQSKDPRAVKFFEEILTR
ncbi:MAG: HEAT repeat domain-containing protein [Bryobacteraceae bacterium]